MNRATLSIAVLLLTAIGCATPSPPAYDPFKINREEFFSKVKTIALAPVRVPVNLEDPDVVKTKYEALITERLRARGFVVVQSGEFEAIYNKTIGQMGGVYDPITGKLDEVKGKALQQHTLRELQRVVHADAVLFSSVKAVVIKHVNGIATWDGVSESISGSAISGGMDRFLTAGRHGGSSGTVGALSLLAVIDDMNAMAMYANAGGIQLAGRLSGGKFEMVPRAELFATDERYTKSIDLALRDLMQNYQTSEGIMGRSSNE